MSRETDYPIEPLFMARWSPRAFDEGIMPEEDLLTMLEAARWAPSSSNLQPWRFVYALRGDDLWEEFVGFMVSGNAAWGHRASALVVLLSDSIAREATDDKPVRMNDYASFDAGAAWAQLALQAHESGYRTHAMAGIHFDHIRSALNIPERYKIEIVIAIGRQANAAILPEALQERETPSDRKALSEIAFHGKLPE